MIQEHLTPEQIENTTFPVSPHGYEPAHVEAFLRNLAQQVRDLERAIELAELKASKPFEATGKHIGDLMQRAHELAEMARTEAKLEAATTVQAARKEADRLRAQADEVLRDARRQADELVAAAQREADQMRDKLLRARQRIQAEAAVLKQQAQREAGHIISTAKKKAAEAATNAARRAEERKRELELKVIALKEKEQAMRARLATLSAQARALQASTRAAEKTEAEL